MNYFSVGMPHPVWNQPKWLLYLVHDWYWGVFGLSGKLHGQICQHEDTKCGHSVKVIGIQSQVLNVTSAAGWLVLLVLSLNSVNKISLSLFLSHAFVFWPIVGNFKWAVGISKVQHWEWLLASHLIVLSLPRRKAYKRTTCVLHFSNNNNLLLTKSPIESHWLHEAIETRVLA